MALTLRSARLIGGVAALALGGTLLLAGTAAASSPDVHAADAPTPVTKVTICHRDDNVKKPYGPKAIEVNANGTVDGHTEHTGPVFEDGMTSGWGDIIPPFYWDDHGTVTLFAGYNWTAQGQEIWNNGCSVPTETTTVVTTPTTATSTETTTTTVTSTLPTTDTATDPTTTTQTVTTEVPTTNTDSGTVTTQVPTTVTTEVPTTITTAVPTTVTTRVTTTVPSSVVSTVTQTVPTSSTVLTKKQTDPVTSTVPTDPVTGTDPADPATSSVQTGPPSATAHTGQDGYGAVPYIAMAGGLLLLLTGWRRRTIRGH